MAIELISLRDIKISLNIPSGDTNKDSVLLEWIRDASELVEKRYVCQPIISATVSNFEFDGTGVQTYTPPYRPITSLTSLESRNGYGSNETWTALDTTQYKLLPRPGYQSIYLSGGFTDGINNYRATFVSGYAATAVPYPIQKVVREMVGIMYKEWEGGLGEPARLGVSSTSEAANGTTTSTAFQDMRPAWMGELSPYRVQPI